MHPVLVFVVIFIPTMIGLLFLFEKYQLGSIYLLLFIAVAITYIFGKLLIRLFPSQDPMRNEVQQEAIKVRSNQYQREIQFIFNIVQPDPRLQPNPKRIADSLDECFSQDAAITKQRLQQHFGESFDIETSQPLPDMIEAIKAKYTDWV